jgi:hypothetical protein
MVDKRSLNKPTSLHWDSRPCFQQCLRFCAIPKQMDVSDLPFKPCRGLSYRILKILGNRDPILIQSLIEPSSSGIGVLFWTIRPSPSGFDYVALRFTMELVDLVDWVLQRPFIIPPPERLSIARVQCWLYTTVIYNFCLSFGIHRRV